MNTGIVGKSLALRLRSVLALVLASALVLAACAAPAPTPTPTPQPKPAQQSKPAASTPAPAKASPSPAAAKAKPTTAPEIQAMKIKIGYSAVDPGNTPLWTAYERGFLKKNGLDAELYYVEGGTKAVQALIAGDIPITSVAGSGVVEAIASGAQITIIASTGSGFPYKFISASGIKKPEDLKGKNVGISRFGSSSDFSLRQALKAMKLDPAKDVNILEIGSDNTRVAAMQSGAIAGTVLNPPGTTMLLKAGFNELLNMSTLTDVPYQHGTYATGKAFAKSNRDVVLRFMKAIVEGIHFEKTNKEEAKKILGKYTKMDDLDGLEEAYMLYNGPDAKLLFPAPYPSRKGVEVVLEEVTSKKPDAKSLKVDDVIDESFVKELEDSGFVKSVWDQK